MLQIAINYCEIRRAARKHAFDNCRSQPATANALNATHSRIGDGDFSRDARRAIGGVVVDENDLPLNTLQSIIELPDQYCNVVPLVETRHYDGEFDRFYSRFKIDRHGDDPLK